MSIVHIMSGLPASGKSTFARELGVYRFNLDDYRAMLGCDDRGNEREPLAIEAMLSAAEVFVRVGQDIVLDNTHLTQKWPGLYRQRFGPHGVEFRVHDLTDVELSECLFRNAQRFGSKGFVPNNVIETMAKTLEKNLPIWKLTDEWMNQ